MVIPSLFSDYLFIPFQELQVFSSQRNHPSWSNLPFRDIELCGCLNLEHEWSYHCSGLWNTSGPL